MTTDALSNPRAPGLRRKLILSAVVSGLLVTAIWFQAEIRREIFILGARSDLSSIRSKADLGQRKEAWRFAFFTLPDGKWAVATAEHACCSGAGYNAVVIRDSDGHVVVDRALCLCGGVEIVDIPRTGNWSAEDPIPAKRILKQLQLDYGVGQ